LKTAKAADCKCAKKCWSSLALNEYTEVSFICVLKLHALEHGGCQKPERNYFVCSGLVEFSGFFFQMFYLVRLQSDLTIRHS